MKWFFHFTPPETEIVPGCGSGDGFRLFESDYGRSFSAFPCGAGSVYVGAGRGCVRLPATCFSHSPELDQETRMLKDSLSAQTQAIKRRILQALGTSDVRNAWRMLFEYWWTKLGLHEYAHDVSYEVGRDGEAMPTHNVRDYLLTAMYRSLTADTLDISRLGASAVEHFVRYQMTWNRFACCAFDCGPIAIGKSGFVPYEQLAAARRNFFDHRDISTATRAEKRSMARAALDDDLDFLMPYYEDPLSSMRLYGEFTERNPTLLRLISDMQHVLNSVILREDLELPVLSYIPMAPRATS